MSPVCLGNVFKLQRIILAAAIALSLVPPALAHRLDEYLQATLISVEKNRIEAQIRLAPGVAVLPLVLARIDTDADGVISKPEEKAYARRVLGDLSLSIDGNRLIPRIISARFPGMQELKEGLGEIQLDLVADVPPGGRNRKLILENRHQSRIGVYLVNCLVTRDPDIQVIAQNRNYTQSFYELDYAQAGVPSGPLSIRWWSGERGWLGAFVFLLFTRLALVLRRHA